MVDLPDTGHPPSHTLRRSPYLVRIENPSPPPEAKNRPMKYLSKFDWIPIDRRNSFSYNLDRLLNWRFKKRFHDRYRGEDQASPPDQRPLPGRSRRASGAHQGSHIADRAEPGLAGGSAPPGDPVGAERNPLLLFRRGRRGA